MFDTDFRFQKTVSVESLSNSISFSYLQLKWMNSAILPSQSPDLLPWFTNFFCLWFYCHNSWDVHAVEPCLLPTHLLEYSPYLFSQDIWALVLHNSNTSLPFAQTKVEWAINKPQQHVHFNIDENKSTSRSSFSKQERRSGDWLGMIALFIHASCKYERTDTIGQ